MQFTLSIGFCPTEWYLPLAVAAEEAGFDSIAVPDGLFYYETVSTPYPYSPDGSRFWSPETEFLDPFVVITAMAAVTKRIRFYPSVLKLAVREPLLVAKELSSCAVLSGGRVGLGAGLSPWPEDFEVLRQEWANRGPRSAEMIEIIRGLMAGGMFGYEGRFYSVPRMQIAPVPSQPVPIYLGGLAEPVLRRAARIADGYIGWENPQCPLDEVAGMVKRINGYREDYGRSSHAFEFKFMPSSNRPDVLARLRDAGVSDLIVMPWVEDAGLQAPLAARIDAVHRFAETQIPALRQERG
jgi:alkanesulfonate monooxygenase SsuD/methylene tetrahydromethanopterin reductase-like flavin-dependent oxidoreductase (luciferase family)